MKLPATGGAAFEYKTFDGKNWECSSRHRRVDYDLVIMGALGMGAVKDSMVGSVTMGPAPDPHDSLVIRDAHPFAGRSDGSWLPSTAAAIVRGLAPLSSCRAFGKTVEAVSVYDPYLH